MLTVNEDQSGISILGTEGSAWFANTSGYVQMSAKNSSLWKFVKVGTSTDITSITATPGNSQLYDLMGRPVSKATSGIYILNGKKIVIK